MEGGGYHDCADIKRLMRRVRNGTEVESTERKGVQWERSLVQIAKRECPSDHRENA